MHWRSVGGLQQVAWDIEVVGSFCFSSEWEFAAMVAVVFCGEISFEKCESGNIYIYSI